MSLATWWRRRDPGFRILLRATRITVAGCIGFYFCQLVLDDQTTALYAIFGTIALGGLAEVSGPPAQRTKIYAAALAAGILLVTLGTLLAFSTLAAAAGMLVIGFAIAFAGIGGPRLSGVGNALQLLYILPCFPPFAPDTLPERLLGLIIGIGLLAVADRVLLPDPAPPRFADRLAGATESAARYAAAVSAAMAAPEGAATLRSAEITALRDAAVGSADRLRPPYVPVAERPTGPGVRDRSLTHATAEVKMMTSRLATLVALVADVHPPLPAESMTGIAGLLHAIRRALHDAGRALSGAAQPPDLTGLDAAISEHLAHRAALLGAAGVVPEGRLRAGIVVHAIAVAARGLVLATRGALGAPVASDPAIDDPAGLWFLAASPMQRWWQLVRAHATPRSVYFQNAVRLAVGLTAARVIAGVLSLSHGFWVVLATLSLMRTSVGASRAALVPALVGTTVGGALAAAMLVFVGDDPTRYAQLLPLVLLVAFVAGPLFGLAAGQGGFTLVVAVVFAQLAPATWRLAEARLTDVLVGGVVGLLIGALIWPRGGGGELRKVAAAALQAGADEIVATSRRLAGVDAAPEPAVPVARLCRLLDISYAQFRAEPDSPSANLDWLAVLGVVHRLADDVATLRQWHPGSEPLPWPGRADELCTAGTELAEAYRAAAEAVRAGRPPPDRAAGIMASFTAHHGPVSFAADPTAALRVLDAWGWLYGLAEDLAGIERALVPVVRQAADGSGRAAEPSGGPSTGPSTRQPARVRRADP